jgi:hypothetical protein
MWRIQEPAGTFNVKNDFDFGHFVIEFTGGKILGVILLLFPSSKPYSGI